MESFDLVVVGGGVIGCAVARTALLKHPHLKLILLEREPAIAMHQSGRNSGVLHVGYNQKPGTTKARFVVEGNRRIREYCQIRNLPLLQDGIVVVAQNAAEEKTIAELHKRGKENGAQVELIDQNRLRHLEPHAQGTSALWAPEGASFDAVAFTQALANDVKTQGGELSLAEDVLTLSESAQSIEVRTAKRTLQTKFLVNAGGLRADRLAHQLGIGSAFQIIPFRGEYYQLTANQCSFVRAHVYAAPDLNFPFLKVHFSRTITGQVTIGPGAVLAFGRHAYDRFSLHLPDLLEMLGFKGFWQMVCSEEFRKLATDEWRKSLFRRAVYDEARQLIPAIQYHDLIPYRAGIRAQLVNSSGKLVDDLVVEQTNRSLHVLNAVSPALTCSLPFADHLLSILSDKMEQ